MTKRFALICLFLLVPGISFAQPSISFRHRTYDFGSIEPGNRIEHAFVFSNKGDRELVIKKLVPS